MTTRLRKHARNTVKAVRAGPAQLKGKLAQTGGEIHGPSPNPATNLVIADIALRSGAALARRALERSVLGGSYSSQKAKSILKGRTITESLVHGALARVALHSVPGAIIVGGALLAKTLYDRRRGYHAKVVGEIQLQEMAEDGQP